MNVFSAVLRAVGAGVSEFAESLFPAPNVDEVGPQWLNEFEEKREVIEPGYDLEALFDERARRYESSLTSTLTVRCGRCPAEFTGDSALATLYRHLADQHPDSSAAVSAAADPSPADNHHASRGAGDEGPEGASAIPPAAPSGHPTNAVAVCDVMDFRETHLPLRCTLDADHGGDHVAHGWGGQTWATWPQSMRADPESDPWGGDLACPGGTGTRGRPGRAHHGRLRIRSRGRRADRHVDRRPE